MILDLLVFLFFGKHVTGNRKELQDCSYKFRNRLASLSDFLTPADPTIGLSSLGQSMTNARDIRMETKFQWHLHETFIKGANNETNFALYMESMKYPNYYLGGGDGSGKCVKLVYRTYKPSSVNNNWGDKIKIYCPDCEPFPYLTEEPHNSEDDLEDAEHFKSCHVQILAKENQQENLMMQSFVDMGCIGAYENGEEDGGFDFTISSPKTRTYWQKVKQVQNCNSSEPMEASTTIKQSIVRTDDDRWYRRKDVLRGAGSRAVKFLKLHAPDVKTSFSWQKVNIDEMISSKEHVIGKAKYEIDKLKPGHKRIIYQWVGEAAYFKLATDRVKTCDAPCNLVDDQDVDKYCHNEIEKSLKNRICP